VVENDASDLYSPMGLYLYTPSPDVHRVTYLSRCTFISDGPFDIFWDSVQKGVLVPEGLA
ncbi:MAG: hypothetical protein ACRDJ9_30805, partial [Dehalococcoidia bacterium]